MSDRDLLERIIYNLERIATALETCALAAKAFVERASSGDAEGSSEGDGLPSDPTPRLFPWSSLEEDVVTHIFDHLPVSEAMTCEAVMRVGRLAFLKLPRCNLSVMSTIDRIMENNGWGYAWRRGGGRIQ